MKFAYLTILASLFVFVHSYHSKDVYRSTITQTSSRIIGGVPADRQQFPYHVSVRWSPGIFGYSHICGGTLIHPSFVLTAAHCKQSFGVYEVGLGLLNSADDDHPDNEFIKVSKFIAHVRYPGGVAAYDIAILKLRYPAQITKAVKPANLPLSKQDCDLIVAENLSGWGLTSVILPLPPRRLHWANLPRINNDRCIEVLKALLGSSEPFDETMVCTGSNIGKSESACSGDSGGPLVNNNTDTLIGVTSWGIKPCGTKDAPSVYTNVCSHLDWIEYQMKNNL